MNVTKAHIEEAINLISEPYGWCRKRLSREENRNKNGYAFCMLGALSRACNTVHVNKDPIKNPIKNIYSLVWPSQMASGEMVYFNDFVAKGKKDVIKALQDLIKLNFSE